MLELTTSYFSGLNWRLALDDFFPSHGKRKFHFQRKNIEKSLVEDSFDFIFAIIP